MKKYEQDVIDGNGNAISGLTVDVYNASTLVHATIYSDDGVTPTGNPLTTSASGTYKFYVKDGRYDITISGTGYTTRTIADVEIADVTEATGTDSAATWKTGISRW
jgi:homoserine kinase